MGLNGAAIMNLVNAIVPLYISIALGFVMTKLKIVTYENHYIGIVTFCFKVTTPPLVFQMVAANNPYKLDLRLIGADSLCKGMVLLVLTLSCFWRPTARHVAWVSAYFNLATMSNTVLVGIPLVTALYPGTETGLTAIVFMQCLVWFSVCIFILELHKVLLENHPKKGNEQVLELHEVADELKKDESLARSESPSNNGWSESPSNNGWTETRRSSSVEQASGIAVEALDAAAATTTAIAVTQPRENGHRQVHIIVVQSNGGHIKEVEARTIDRKLPEPAALPAEGSKLTKLRVVKRIMKAVAVNFVGSPIVWSSLIGFVYALLNFRFNQREGQPQPVILKSTISLLANCTLGLAMFMLGMHMAGQKKLIACGVTQALMGAAIRFVVSPALMAFAAFAVGIRGEMFRFAVLQAMLPQSVTSFVFASTYHVHEDIFSTALWFQTLTFFPVAVALYSLLNLGA